MNRKNISRSSLSVRCLWTSRADTVVWLDERLGALYMGNPNLVLRLLVEQPWTGEWTPYAEAANTIIRRLGLLHRVSSALSWVVYYAWYCFSQSSIGRREFHVCVNRSSSRPHSRSTSSDNRRWYEDDYRMSPNDNH